MAPARRDNRLKLLSPLSIARRFKSAAAKQRVSARSASDSSQLDCASFRLMLELRRFYCAAVFSKMRTCSERLLDLLIDS